MTEPNDAETPTATDAASRPRRSVDMRYINVLASLLAVFVSLLSLWLAWSANRTQERMLAASSWPYLRFGHGNFDVDTGLKTITIGIGNGGSGPAVLHWVQISRNGTAYGDAYTMLRDCCGLAAGSCSNSSTARTRPRSSMPSTRPDGRCASTPATARSSATAG